jgi:hypothetical protein
VGPQSRMRKTRALDSRRARQSWWTTQQAYEGLRDEAPRITFDAAMILVDQDLAAAGSSASCIRADVLAAFDYLSNPLIARAERIGDSIVIAGPP